MALQARDLAGRPVGRNRCADDDGRGGVRPSLRDRPRDPGPCDGTAVAIGSIVRSGPRRQAGATLAIVAIAALAIAVGSIRRARAQCAASASSCLDCHEVQARRPVLDGDGPWHRDHAFGDLCVACHAGDPAATEALAAHAAIRDPLADPANTCGGCHDDHAARAERYQAAAPIASTLPPPPAPPAAGATTARAPAAIDRVLAVTAVVLAGAIAWMVRRRGGRRSLIGWLRAPSWSPYVAGAGLGVVVALTEGLLRRPLSASAAFDKLAAYPGRALFPSSPYYAHVMTPAITWQVWLMVGVLAGAFASSRLADDAHARWLPDAQWIPRFGVSRGRRLLIAFVGAVLVQLGAGIAGGCTSGLAISGGALLAPAAFLFMAGMFAGGLPTAAWWYRRSAP